MIKVITYVFNRKQEMTFDHYFEADKYMNILEQFGFYFWIED